MVMETYWAGAQVEWKAMQLRVEAVLRLWLAVSKLACIFT
jgi:hypothetical protein